MCGYAHFVIYPPTPILWNYCVPHAQTNTQAHHVMSKWAISWFLSIYMFLVTCSERANIFIRLPRTSQWPREWCDFLNGHKISRAIAGVLKAKTRHRRSHSWHIFTHPEWLTGTKWVGGSRLYCVDNQAILEALLAILGHKSAHSLATGPVMALPVT